MKRHVWTAAVVLAAAAILSAGPNDEPNEKKIAIDAAPPAVKAAILKAVGDGTIRDVGEFTEKGKVVRYEVEYHTKAGQEIDLVVGPEGKVLSEMKETNADEKPPTRPATREKPWKDTFKVDKKNLVSVGCNPYWLLIPGRKLHLSGGGETVVITVLNETKTVDGVECRVVEERETKRGVLAEVSRNYFAIDKTTNDVYYFGEDVEEYDATGKTITGRGGAWLSGVNGARFGLFMPGGPRVGQRFYQEVAPKVAMDRCEVAQLDAPLKTPMKTFTHCVLLRESSPLESGGGSKWFAAGVGMVGDDEMRLTKVEEPETK